MSAPPADHPDLYYAFFTKGPQDLKAAAGVIDIDNAKINSLAATIANDLQALDQHRQSYQSQAKSRGVQPKSRTLQAFDAARILTCVRGANLLRRNVSFQSWNQFHDWLNGTFRATVGRP